MAFPPSVMSDLLQNFVCAYSDCVFSTKVTIQRTTFVSKNLRFTANEGQGFAECQAFPFRAKKPKAEDMNVQWVILN